MTDETKPEQKPEKKIKAVKPKIVEDREELDSNDLLPEKAQGMDPNKDYCKPCHDQGRVTELRKGWTTCPVCGNDLDW